MLQQSLTIGFSLGRYGEMHLHEATWKRAAVRLLRQVSSTHGPGLRRQKLEERAGLEVDGVLSFARSGEEAGEWWLATVPASGPLLFDWLRAIQDDPSHRSPAVACRAIAQLAAITHAIYRDTEHLPSGLIEDVVWLKGGAFVVGSLGELTSRPRLPESDQVAHLTQLVRTLSGGLPACVEETLRELGDTPSLRQLAEGMETHIGHPKLAITTQQIEALRDRVAARGPHLDVPVPHDVADVASASPVPPLASTGAVVGEKYRLVRSLGSGAKGHVYEAEALANGHPFAVKILGNQDHDVEGFLRDARALSSLHHPNIVSVHDFGHEGGCWLAMEVVDGPSLATRLGDADVIPLSEALKMGRQLCAGLGHAHSRGVVHANLTTASVLLASEAPLMVKLTDFRLGVRREDEGLQAAVASDIHSLGVVLFRMLVGVGDLHPVGTPMPALSEVAATPFPRLVEETVARCLAASPAAPFASITELDEALARCIVQARNPNHTTPPPLSRNSTDAVFVPVTASPAVQPEGFPMWFWAAAAFVLLLGAGLGFTLFQ